MAAAACRTLKGRLRPSVRPRNRKTERSAPAQTDSAITTSLGNYYTKQETRTMILQDLESYYTKEDTDNKIATELENYYEKTEVENLVASVTATDVAITDTANYFNGENVEAALQEIGATLAGVATALATQSEVVA